MNKRSKIFFISFLSIVFLFFIGLIIYLNILENDTVKKLSFEEEQKYLSTLYEKYQKPLLSNLYYKVNNPNLKLNAQSAIIIDASNGNILFEKNSDKLIPPASMTKLVVMYLVLDAVENNQISLNENVIVPEQAWAKNAPPHSSLMFLGKGQKVTLDEILTGMAVVSGNDAAYAASILVFGSVENCVNEMNSLMQNLGLTKTHFVEVSGYSEKNITTAKDFASFSRIYINRFPEVLQKYHSVKSFTYPKKKNLASGIDYEDALINGIPLEGTMPITQNATNRVLNVIPGSDGLKTGYIDESGYNLSLTVKRNDTRFISVTMGGSGENSYEGNTNRVKDATELINWAYDNFETTIISQNSNINMLVLCGKDNYLQANEAWNKQFSVTKPKISFENSLNEESDKDKTTNNAITKRIVLQQKILKAPIECGEQIGYAEYIVDNIVIDKVPIICSKSVSTGNIFKQLYGNIIFLLKSK